MKNIRVFPKFSANTRNIFWALRKARNFGNYDIVKVGNVSPQKTVPDYIIKPSYWKTGDPEPGPDKPEIKGEDQISGVRRSCKLAANILQSIESNIKIGQTTDDIDTFIHNLTVENNAYPSPLNYKRFPKSVCTCVNNIACHGIPDDRPLLNGDIINVDITVYYKGYHGDCSRTFLIGDVDKIGSDLVKANEMCVYETISSVCKPGKNISDIGYFIEQRAQQLGYNVIPAFVGHGIGEYFHGAPDIYHIANCYPGKMQPGMIFTIEPVFTCGSQEIEILEDNWTAVTVDCSRTAQFEHTVLITKDGAEILTTAD